jgi:hypothetical protein
LTLCGRFGWPAHSFSFHALIVRTKSFDASLDRPTYLPYNKCRQRKTRDHASNTVAGNYNWLPPIAA